MSVQCAVCGRTLTDPKSIAAGVGPECGKKRQGKRHRGPGYAPTGGGSYENGANGHGVTAPPQVGEPMTRDEALAALRRIAEGQRVELV